MPTPSAITDLSTTAASNSPAGSESPNTADDYFRAVSALLRQEVGGDFVDVASASTAAIGAAASTNVRITGTTTITSFGTIAAGIVRHVRFAGALTLTHNGTSLILPGGANITTAANDCLRAVSLGSGNWLVTNYTYATPPAQTFTDSTPIVKGSSDATKQVRFEVDGLTTGTTRVVTVPDADGTIAYLASPAFTGNPTAPTPSSGDNDTSIATTEFVNTYAPGTTYTPTATNVSNTTIGSVYQHRYIRTGSVVTLSGAIDVTPGSAAGCQVGVTIPVASNFTSLVHAAGVMCTNLKTVGYVAADSTNDRLQLEWTAPNTSAVTLWYTATYTVM